MFNVNLSDELVVSCCVWLLVLDHAHLVEILEHFAYLQYE